MANQLKIGARVHPTQANGGISTGAIAIYPCFHSNTESSLTDISGNNNHGAPGVAFSAATQFATPTGLTNTDGASTDTTMRIPLANWTYNYNAGDNLLVAGMLKMASLPSSSKPIWAQGGNNSTAQGPSLKISSGGVLFWQLDNAGASIFAANTDAGGPANNGVLTTAVWHHVMFAMWNHNVSAGTATFGIWLNGARGFSVADKSLSSLPASIAPVEAVRIGQYYRTSGPTTLSFGATQNSYHFYRSPNSVIWTQTQMDGLAKRLHRSPVKPLSAAEWRMA